MHAQRVFVAEEREVSFRATDRIKQPPGPNLWVAAVLSVATASNTVQVCWQHDGDFDSVRSCRRRGRAVHNREGDGDDVAAVAFHHSIHGSNLQHRLHRDDDQLGPVRQWVPRGVDLGSEFSAFGTFGAVSEGLVQQPEREHHFQLVVCSHSRRRRRVVISGGSARSVVKAGQRNGEHLVHRIPGCRAQVNVLVRNDARGQRCSRRSQV